MEYIKVPINIAYHIPLIQNKSDIFYIEQILF